MKTKLIKLNSQLRINLSQNKKIDSQNSPNCNILPKDEKSKLWKNPPKNKKHKIASNSQKFDVVRQPNSV